MVSMALVRHHIMWMIHETVMRGNNAKDFQFSWPSERSVGCWVNECLRDFRLIKDVYITPIGEEAPCNCKSCIPITAFELFNFHHIEGTEGMVELRFCTLYTICDLPMNTSQNCFLRRAVTSASKFHRAERPTLSKNSPLIRSMMLVDS